VNASSVSLADINVGIKCVREVICCYKDQSALSIRHLSRVSVSLMLSISLRIIVNCEFVTDYRIFFYINSIAF